MYASSATFIIGHLYELIKKKKNIRDAAMSKTGELCDSHKLESCTALNNKFLEIWTSSFIYNNKLSVFIIINWLGPTFTIIYFKNTEPVLQFWYGGHRKPFIFTFQKVNSVKMELNELNRVWRDISEALSRCKCLKASVDLFERFLFNDSVSVMMQMVCILSHHFLR